MIPSFSPKSDLLVDVESAPDGQYATRQEAIVKEEYNRLPEADKSPGKGMWLDLSQNEKFPICFRTCESRA